MVPILDAYNLGQNRWKICTSPPLLPPPNQGWENGAFWLLRGFILGGGGGGGLLFYFILSKIVVKNCVSLLTAVNALSLKVWTHPKTTQFSRLFHSNTIPLLALLGIFTDPSDRFPYPFVYFNQWNSYPFRYLKPEKGTPFGWSLPV